ncbi:MAG: DUF1573 domain-containing protein [Bacteroidota bacterium]
MKLYLSAALLFSLAVLAGCSGQKNGDDKISTDVINIPSDSNSQGDLPVMTFAETEHDFGTITEGEKVSYVFQFRNTGKSDLVISSAQGSCGCTVPEYPKRPIAPGETDKITVTFDSNGKPGMNHKDITVVTNCQPNTQMLKITANVIKPEDKQ